MTDFNELLGKTLTDIEIEDDTITFTTNEGERYRQLHSQDCCEDVYIEDFCGDKEDLIGSPILLAEEVTYDDETPEGVKLPHVDDTYTWTFYKLSTIKGSVTIRWFGTSNGYYSQSVSFYKLQGGQ